MKKFFLSFAFFVCLFSLSAQNIDNKFCGIVIVLPDQDYFKYQGDLSTSKLCYTHDNSGNLIGKQNCPSLPSSSLRSSSVNNFAKEEIIDDQQGPLELGDSFVAYPNPTDGLFYLSMKNNTENPLASIRLISVGTGQSSLIPFSKMDSRTTIDLSAQPSGIYILQLLMSNGTAKTIKVIRK